MYFLLEIRYTMKNGCLSYNHQKTPDILPLIGPLHSLLAMLDNVTHDIKPSQLWIERAGEMQQVVVHPRHNV